MAKKESTKIGKLFKSMVAIVVISLASVGATLFYTDKLAIPNTQTSIKSEAEEPAPVLADPIFTPLEPFTVTLRSDRGNRILYVGITLRLEDENSRRTIEQFMPEVRDRVLRTLSEQDPQHIQTPDGRAQLVRVINDGLEAPYHPQPRGPRISSVLFTAFVIQ